MRHRALWGIPKRMQGSTSSVKAGTWWGTKQSGASSLHPPWAEVAKSVSVSKAAPQRERRAGYVSGTSGHGGAVELTALGWASSQRDAQCLLTITAKFSQAQLLTSQAKYVRWLFTC